MENLHFNAFFQKTANGKTIMVAVLPDDFICDGLPVIYEARAIKVAPTVFTGAYPTIKILPDTIKDVTEDFAGKGIGGIITEAQWLNHVEVTEDYLGISL